MGERLPGGSRCVAFKGARGFGSHALFNTLTRPEKRVCLEAPLHEFILPGSPILAAFRSRGQMLGRRTGWSPVLL
jgi:hypothetical protein